MNSIFLLLSFPAALAFAFKCPDCAPEPSPCPTCPPKPIIAGYRYRCPPCSTPTPPPVVNPVNILCNEIRSKPALGGIVLAELTTIFNNSSQVGQLFPETIDYIDNSNDQAELLGGVTKCIQFFAGLKSALLTDVGGSHVIPLG